jgi:formate C-acetyltransferase
MQFFGARCNLPKLLLLAINGGRDETTGEQIAPDMDPLGPEQLDYRLVSERLDIYLDWLSRVYADTMNIIHFMHDKYAYESLQMAFHDSQVQRCMAFGVAGLSVITDSLSAIRYGTVYPVINESGLITSYQVSGNVPLYGNDDDRADRIAADLISSFSDKLSRQPIYRNASPTLSVLTITSNVVYGQKTGDTPDGRKAGEPFAPGANPMHGRDNHGALASLNSIAKIPYEHCLDGISCTFSVIPRALGRDDATRIQNLAAVLDGYFSQKAHHININVLDRSTLEEAIAHPERFPHLTIRVSGYAVHFHKLSRLQQQEVLSRTFHDAL